MQSKKPNEKPGVIPDGKAAGPSTREISTKASERHRLTAWRQGLDPAQARDWAESIALHLNRLLTTLAVGQLAVYMPIRGEPDLTDHYPDYAEKCALSLPLCDPDGQLRFMSWAPEEPLVAGRYDIPVPVSGQLVIPDTIVVPCVGFDRSAYRLGYGGGWFDRTLPGLPDSVRVIGVAYAGQISAFVPEPHDRPLLAVLTENGFSAGASGLTGLQ